MTLFINGEYVAEYYLDFISDTGLLGLFLGASDEVANDAVDYVYFESLNVYRY